MLSVRVDESLYFANARWLEDQLYDRAIAEPGIRHVVLICSAVNEIDASALESLEALAERLADAGVAFHLSEVKGPVLDRLKRSDFLQHLTGQVFLSQHDALAAPEVVNGGSYPTSSRLWLTSQIPLPFPQRHLKGFEEQYPRELPHFLMLCYRQTIEQLHCFRPIVPVHGAGGSQCRRLIQEMPIHL